MFGEYKGHYRALIRLGLPLVVGQLGVIVLGFADTLMIGHYNTESLGAASFVNNIVNLVIIFCTGFSYGLTPVVGGLFGKGQLGEAGRALKCSLWANFAIGILVTVVLLAVYWNVERLGQPEELMPLVKPYFLILIASLVAVMLFNGFKQFTDGITDTKTAMWILLGGNLFNIGGNYLLIYGKFGFPELGLLGAGVSTLLSRVLMVAAFAVIFFRSSRFRPYRIGFGRLGFSVARFKELNRLGWPVGLQMGMEGASFSLSAVMIGWIGTIALASHQIMLTISTIAFLVYYGMGAAVAVRVSNYCGQSDWVNVRRSAYAGFHLMMVMAVFFCILLFSTRNYLGSWFTDNREVGAMVVTLSFPFLLYQFGDGLQVTFANALRGISDVKPMIAIAFIAYFVVSLPVGYVFGFLLGWGVFGVWMSYPFGLTCAGILLYLRFRRRLSRS
ncbi:MAG: MATE family efflux transporter [Mediterranea sp.]|jgi:MATE family multidrug resistance protein|nr:MATE family efflux transporter [Mediterranea sp.]